MRQKPPIVTADLACERSLSELKGFLEAFSWVNSKTNHGYTFEVHLLSKTGSTIETLQTHYHDVTDAVQLTRVEDWPKELSRSLERWLCDYLTDPELIGRLTDRNQTFSLSCAPLRKDMAESVLQRIRSLIQPAAVWKVNLDDKKRFYECSWEDYALEDSKHVLLIHLGVSD